MKVVSKIELGNGIMKSILNDAGDMLLVLFDDSKEFVLLSLLETQPVILYKGQMQFVITDASFYTKRSSILFSMLGSSIVEWDYILKESVGSFGNLINNVLDKSLSGYSSVEVVLKHNLVVAANIGSAALEFFDIHTFAPFAKTNALSEVYTRKIVTHPTSDFIAVLISVTEDAGYLRFYEIKNGTISLFKKYVSCLFSPGSVSFDPTGSKVLITGGYPPFFYQVNQFPTLSFVSEFIDDGGMDIPEPWGLTNGIAFNCDIVYEEDSFMYVPYYNGDVCKININDGRIVESITCNKTLSVSLHRIPNKPFLLCSSISGEVSVIQLKQEIRTENDKQFDIDKLYSIVELTTPLAEMEEISSVLDDPHPIRK